MCVWLPCKFITQTPQVLTIYPKKFGLQFPKHFPEIPYRKWNIIKFHTMSFLPLLISYQKELDKINNGNVISFGWYTNFGKLLPLSINRNPYQFFPQMARTQLSKSP